MPSVLVMGKSFKACNPRLLSRDLRVTVSAGTGLRSTVSPFAGAGVTACPSPIPNIVPSISPSGMSGINPPSNSYCYLLQVYLNVRRYHLYCRPSQLMSHIAAEDARNHG